MMKENKITQFGPAKVGPSLNLARQNYRINVYQNLLNKLNDNQVKLVAVSKTQPPDRILELYNSGQRVFAENRVQELLSKVDQLPEDIEWHLIGHLQTNKVKYIASFVSMIQSVDSLRLLVEIEKQARKVDRIIDCLLQFHIAREETKFGLSEDEAVELLESEGFHQMPNVRICGVMGMASFTDNEDVVHSEFRHLHSIFQKLKTDYFKDKSHFREISMGMSSDWEIAVQEGSTMVRIGSLLFGPRQ